MCHSYTLAIHRAQTLLENLIEQEHAQLQTHTIPACRQIPANMTTADTAPGGLGDPAQAKIRVLQRLTMRLNDENVNLRKKMLTSTNERETRLEDVTGREKLARERTEETLQKELELERHAKVSQVDKLYAALKKSDDRFDKVDNENVELRRIMGEMGEKFAKAERENEEIKCASSSSSAARASSQQDEELQRQKWEVGKALEMAELEKRIRIDYQPVLVELSELRKRNAMGDTTLEEQTMELVRLGTLLNAQHRELEGLKSELEIKSKSPTVTNAHLEREEQLQKLERFSSVQNQDLERLREDLKALQFVREAEQSHADDEMQAHRKELERAQAEIQASNAALQTTGAKLALFETESDVTMKLLGTALLASKAETDALREHIKTTESDTFNAGVEAKSAREVAEQASVLQMDLETAEAELFASKAESKALGEQMKQSLGELQSAQGEIDRLRVLEADLVAAKAESEALRAHIGQSELDMNMIESRAIAAEKEIERWQVLEAEFVAVKAESEALRAHINQSESDLSAAESRVLAAQQEAERLRSLEVELDAAKAEAEVLREQERLARQRGEELDNANHRVKELQDALDAESQSRMSESSMLREINRDADVRAEESNEVMQAKHAQLEAMNERSSQAELALETSESRAAAFEAQVLQLQDALAQTEASALGRVAQAEAEMEAMKERAENAETISDAAEVGTGKYKTEAESLRGQLAHLQTTSGEEISGLRADNMVLKEATQRAEELFEIAESDAAKSQMGATKFQTEADSLRGRLIKTETTYTDEMMAFQNEVEALKERASQAEALLDDAEANTNALQAELQTLRALLAQHDTNASDEASQMHLEADALKERAAQAEALLDGAESKAATHWQDLEHTRKQMAEAEVREKQWIVELKQARELQGNAVKARDEMEVAMNSHDLELLEANAKSTAKESESKHFFNENLQLRVQIEQLKMDLETLGLEVGAKNVQQMTQELRDTKRKLHELEQEKVELDSNFRLRQTELDLSKSGLEDERNTTAKSKADLEHLQNELDIEKRSNATMSEEIRNAVSMAEHEKELRSLMEREKTRVDQLHEKTRANEGKLMDELSRATELNQNAITLREELEEERMNSKTLQARIGELQGDGNSLVARLQNQVQEERAQKEANATQLKATEADFVESRDQAEMLIVEVARMGKHLNEEQRKSEKQKVEAEELKKRLDLTLRDVEAASAPSIRLGEKVMALSEELNTERSRRRELEHDNAEFDAELKRLNTKVAEQNRLLDASNANVYATAGSSPRAFPMTNSFATAGGGGRTISARRGSVLESDNV